MHHHLPQELDEAARRRMPKQLYIPLPCAEARRKMVMRQLGPGGRVSAQLDDTDLDKIVCRTAGYSGSDVRNLIQARRRRGAQLLLTRLHTFCTRPDSSS